MQSSRWSGPSHASAQDLRDRMDQIGRALAKVQRVSDVIGAIARQTDMPAIEAARAGAAGRAFAVVATDVVGCVVSDINGYLPLHPTLRSQPQGSDIE